MKRMQLLRCPVVLAVWAWAECTKLYLEIQESGVRKGTAFFLLLVSIPQQRERCNPIRKHWRSKSTVTSNSFLLFEPVLQPGLEQTNVGIRGRVMASQQFRCFDCAWHLQRWFARARLDKKPTDRHESTDHSQNPDTAGKQKHRQVSR